MTMMFSGKQAEILCSSAHHLSIGFSGQQMGFSHRSEVNKHAKQSSADQDSGLIHIKKTVVVNSNNTKEKLFSI